MKREVYIRPEVAVVRSAHEPLLITASETETEDIMAKDVNFSGNIRDYVKFRDQWEE